jgi:hypothetical protein
MNFLHQTPNKASIQKGLGFPYSLLMKSRFLTMTLFCFTHFSAAFSGQRADVLMPYEGPSIPGFDPTTLKGKVMTG